MENWNEIPTIDLYSDGGAEPNPGRGGYGVVLAWNGKKKEFSQGYEMTTNNRMELLGVITGLEKLKTKSNVNVYTDSKYVINGIEKGWAKRWKSNNWYRNKKDKAINSDLWERLLDLISVHTVQFNWVKGHNGHVENERCDCLATQALRSDNLSVDSEFNKPVSERDTELEPQSKPKTSSKLKILKEGDPCKHCTTPVIKKDTKRKKLKSNQTYYFEYYMYCPQCRAIYMVEEAKRTVEKQDPASLF